MSDGSPEMLRCENCPRKQESLTVVVDERGRYRLVCDECRDAR